MYRTKLLIQKPALQGRFSADYISLHLLERIKRIGFNPSMDDYEIRKLGVFNQLNFFQLLTGIIIPVAGLIRNHHFPFFAWIVACIPAFVSVLVLALNSRHRYLMALYCYFILYPL